MFQSFNVFNVKVALVFIGDLYDIITVNETYENTIENTALVSLYSDSDVGFQYILETMNEFSKEKYLTCSDSQITKYSTEMKIENLENDNSRNTTISNGLKMPIRIITIYKGAVGERFVSDRI